MTSNFLIPKISFSTEPTTLLEGAKLYWNFNLSQPVPDKGLTVFVSLLEDTDPTGSDINFFVDGSKNITAFKPLVENGLVNKVAVTLTGGATRATLVSTIINDGIVEEPESITIGLTPGDGYTVDPNANLGSFTLIDNPNPITSQKVPEPNSITALLAIGIIGAAFLRSRWQRSLIS